MKWLYWCSIILPIRDLVIGLIRGIRAEYEANTVHDVLNRRKFDESNGY